MTERERLTIKNPYPLGMGEMPMRGEYFNSDAWGHGHLSVEGRYTIFGKGWLGRLRQKLHYAMRPKPKEYNHENSIHRA